MNERYNNYSIELDCEPGFPRPSDLIDGVLAGTGICAEDFITGDPFFGHQTWVLKKEAGKDDLFTNSKPTFKERVEALYHSGQIRYGSY